MDSGLLSSTIVGGPRLYRTSTELRRSYLEGKALLGLCAGCRAASGHIFQKAFASHLVAVGHSFLTLFDLTSIVSDKHCWQRLTPDDCQSYGCLDHKERLSVSFD